MKICVMENNNVQEQPMNYLLKEILTLKETCDYLGISKSYMYKLTSGRVIPHYCPTGKLIYLKRSEVDEWVLKNRRRTRSEIGL